MHEPDKINLIHSTFCSHLLLHGRKTGLKISKDAGFVYESLRNETNRVIWKKNFHETNPRNESLRFGFANP